MSDFVPTPRPQYVPDPHRRRRAWAKRIRAEDLEGAVPGDTTIRKEGDTELSGDVQLVEGANITLTQDTPDKKITIASAGGGISSYGGLWFDISECGTYENVIISCGPCADNYAPIIQIIEAPSLGIIPNGLNGTLTISEDGVYLVQFDITFYMPPLRLFQLWASIFVDGSRSPPGAMKSYGTEFASNYHQISAQSIIELNAGNVVDTRISLQGPETPSNVEIPLYHLNAIRLGDPIGWVIE